jgi:hypothetical protein
MMYKQSWYLTLKALNLKEVKNMYGYGRACCYRPIVTPVPVGPGVGVGIIAIAILILLALGIIF